MAVLAFSAGCHRLNVRGDRMEIINWREELLPFEQAVDELVIKFKSIRREYIRKQLHSPIEQVEGRVKSVSSILDKANKRNIPVNKALYTLEDIAGVRIICRFVEDIDKVVALARERDGVDMSVIQEEDYVTNTKKSGYRSYHMTVVYPIITATGKKEITSEIQIRTLAMNFWATIEHSLRYKYNGKLPDDLKERLQVCAEAAFKLDTEMTTIRDEMLEAQKIMQTKNNLVNEIINNIHNLYYFAKIEKMNQFNRQFIDLYQEGNIDKLFEFNRQLETMTQLYKVQYG